MATLNETRSPAQTDAAADQPVTERDDLSVIRAIREFKRESEDARRTRINKNRANQRAYMGEQDFSYKKKGQSREFLPKTPMAVEQFASFVKRALVGFGEWFDVQVAPGPLSTDHIRKLLETYLSVSGPVQEDGQPADFATTVSDGTKVGTLSSLMIFKVHGRMIRDRGYEVSQTLDMTELPDGQIAPLVGEELRVVNRAQWKLLVELVRPEDFYPDPTGRGLYRIHQVERDLSDVIDWAKDGLYDMAAVEAIQADFAQMEDESERARQKGQDVSTPPGFRKRVVIDEFWGTILDSDGKVVHENVVAAVANDKYLIRPPEPNPWWHGESPFVVIPLIRVPFSVFHKALADHMTSLNIALNEQWNLMFDGSVASVWGVRQLHADWLEDVNQIADGVPQGTTLRVTNQCPPGAKVMETVTTGEVPKDAMAMFESANREFNAAALTNDLQFGQMPTKEVRATEVIEANVSRSTTLDGIIRDMERGLATVLDKAWMVLLQHADDLASDEVMATIGPMAALALARMSPARRFAEYHGVKMRVFGLSAVLNRAKEFQKMAALLGMVSTNPLLMQAFVQRYSVDRTLDHVLKTLNIDPLALKPDDREMLAMEDRMKQLPFFMQLTGNKSANGGAGLSAQQVGDVSMPAQINQMASPMTGLPANA